MFRATPPPRSAHSGVKTQPQNYNNVEIVFLQFLKLGDRGMLLVLSCIGVLFHQDSRPIFPHFLFSILDVKVVLEYRYTSRFCVFIKNRFNWLFSVLPSCTSGGSTLSPARGTAFAGGGAFAALPVRPGRRFYIQGGWV